MNTKLLLRLLLGAVAVLLFVPLLPLRFELASFHDLSVDVAFQMAMPELWRNGVQFGPGSVFTYGPLGFLAYNFVPYSMFWGLILVRSLLALVFSAGIVAVLEDRSSRLLLGWQLATLAVCSLLFFAGWDQGYWISFSLLTLFVYAGDRRSAPNANATAIALAMAAAATSLIKFNFALLGAFVFALIGVHEVLVRKRFPIVSAVYVLSLFGFWVLCGQSLGNIVTWYSNELELSSGYPDAMSKGILQPYPLALVLAVYAATLLLLIGGIGMKRMGTTPMLAAAIAASGFVSLKHAFGGNQLEQASTELLFLSFLTLTLASSRGRISPKSGATILVCQLVYLVAVFYSGSTATTVAGTPRQLRDRAMQVLKLLHTDLTEYKVGWDHLLQSVRDRAPLSKGLSGTADVYPQKTGVVIADGNLRWTPRPAYLSLNAHTERLAKMNADFLSSARAPDNLLIEMLPPVHNYNNRLPSTTDGPSWIEFLAKYSLSSVSPPFLVLSRADERKIMWGRTKIRSLEVDEYRSVNDRSRPLWATIDIRPSIEGRVLALLYKLPQVYVDLVLNDGRIVSHQILPELGRAGFLLSPYVASKEDLAAFLLGDSLIPSTATSGRRVTSLRWRVEGDLARFYRPQAVIRLTPFSLPPRRLVGLEPTIALQADADCAGMKADYTTVETPDGKSLIGVFAHAPCRSEVLVPDQERRVSFVYGLKDTSISNSDGKTDGAEFRVTATLGEDRSQKEIWAQRLFPSEITADRGPHAVALDIPQGATSLSFETLPIGNNSYDHTYWASVRFASQ